MLRKLPPLDVGGPEEFMTEATMLFAEYPEGIMVPATSLIVRRSDRPTVRVMREVLDELFEPIQRRWEREEVERQAKRALPPPRQKRTPKEQARIDKLVAETRAIFNIPPEGLPPKPVQRRPLLDDPDYARRIAPELTARRAMNELRAEEAAAAQATEKEPEPQP